MAFGYKYILSGELATHLTGRNEQIELFPFSFAEFCQCKGVDILSKTTKAEALRRKTFDEYLQQGGFPELLFKKNKSRYIGTLVDNILKRDIEQRHGIKYVEAFEQLAHYLMNTAPTTIVENELATLYRAASPKSSVGARCVLLQERGRLRGGFCGMPW